MPSDTNAKSGLGKILEARVHKYTAVHLQYFVEYGLCRCKLHTEILHLQLEVTPYFISYDYFFYCFYHFFVLYYYYYYFLRANGYSMLTPPHHLRYQYGVRWVCEVSIIPRSSFCVLLASYFLHLRILVSPNIVTSADHIRRSFAGSTSKSASMRCRC